MLDSLKGDIGPNDAVTILFDGEKAAKDSGFQDSWKQDFKGRLFPIVEKENTGNWGHALRTKYQGQLQPRTTFVLHGDDDDLYIPGFMDKLRKSCNEPEKLYIARMGFKHETYPNEVVPRSDKIEKGNISSQNGVIPYDLVGKGVWNPNYHGDYEYYEQIAKQAKNIEFLPHVIYQVQSDVANKPKYQVYVFYHIYCNEHTLSVLKDQVTKIIFSGLYDRVREIKCFLAGGKQHMDPIKAFLKDSGVKFRIEAVGVDDASFERFTLNQIPKFITDDDKFLYIHTKGVSAKHVANDNVYWWRTWMEYNLMYKFKECLEALDSVNIVGVGYTTKIIGPHFSGNFWWTKGSYFNTLPRNQDGSLNIGNGYTDPENFIFKGKDPKHLDIDEGRAPHPDTDYYSFRPGVRAANGLPKPKKGGRRSRTR